MHHKLKKYILAMVNMVVSGKKPRTSLGVGWGAEAREPCPWLLEAVDN